MHTPSRFSFDSFSSRLLSNRCNVFVLFSCVRLFVFSYTHSSRVRNHWCFNRATCLKKNKVGTDPELEDELPLEERRNVSQVKLNDNKHDEQPGVSQES